MKYLTLADFRKASPSNRRCLRWIRYQIVVAAFALGFGMQTPAQVPEPNPDVTLINPQAIVFSQATGKVYSVNTLRDEVNVSDDATSSVVRVKVGNGPVSIAVNSRDGRAYVTNSGSGTVSVIDGKTDKVIATIPVGSHPYSIATDTATGSIFVSHTFNDEVTVIDSSTGAVTGIRMGSADLIAVNSRTNKVYLLGYEGGDIAVLNEVSHTIGKGSAGKHAWGMALNESSDTLYVAKPGNAELAVLEADSSVAQVIPTGAIPCAVAINYRTNTLYIVNYEDDSMTVINGEKKQVTATVRVGARPQAITVDQKSGLIFVANTRGNSVTVVDGVSNQVLRTVKAGTSPIALVVNPNSGKLHIANLNEESFTVVDLSQASTPRQP